MKIRALRLWNVRKFANRGVALEGIRDGVNVLSAENEFGKSTSFDALHAIFFQPHSGTPKAVQMLRPYSGGSPQIEVDIETDAGHFRINKQYYGGKHAHVTEIDTDRIIAQADEAESWVSSLLSGGSSGPAGLLWVQQGATEIGRGSKTVKDVDRKVRENLLASVTGDEVELLTGGRRMVRVLDKTLSELDRLVTSTGKPKTSGPYWDVLKELDELREKEKSFAIQIEELRTDLDTRRSKSARLAEISNPATIEHQKSDLKQAKLTLQQAEDYTERLAAAQKQQNIILGKQTLAKQRYDAYLTKLDKLSALTEKLSVNIQHHTEAKDKLSRAQAADGSSREVIERCDKNIDEITENLKNANFAKASLEAAAKLVEIRARLLKAAKTRQQLETLEAECAALGISNTDIEYLEKLTKQIAILESTVRVDSGTLKIDYLDGSNAVILKEGHPVKGSQTHNISSTEVFEIPNIGSLTINPGSLRNVDEKQSELRATRESLSMKLSELGFTNLNEAKERQTLFLASSSALMIKRAELEAHSPEGLDQLRSTVAELESRISSTPVELIDINEIENSLQSARINHQEANASRESSRAAFDRARETHLRAEITLKHTRENLNLLEQELGPKVERQHTASALLDEFQQDTAQATDASSLVEKLQADAPDLETVRATQARLSSALERLENERLALGKDIAGLDGRIALFSGHAIEEMFEETSGQRKAVEARVAIIEREIAALSLLKQVLQEARISAREQFFQPVMSELKPLLSLLLDEASITFDDATLLPQTLARKGQDEDISVLSGGMREQLAILTRLAFARLLAKGGDPVPVILDDALVFSDDNRIERMFDALHRQASDIQILVFTCRQRAFEKLGGNGLRMVEWQPAN